MATNPESPIDRTLLGMVALSMAPPPPVAPDSATLRFLQAGRIADQQAAMSLAGHLRERRIA